jgi:glycine dehydrogenase subunit 1
MLQAIFEFQTAICALTGLDVASASLYDGASAAAEAVLMAIRSKGKRSKIIVAETVHPHYLKVVQQYVKSLQIEIVIVPATKDGLVDIKALDASLDENTAAILVQYPNFLGVIDRVSEASTLAKACGALTIVSANPLVYGLFQSAAELGADIAVGDCQPLGLPLQFGGPFVGYLVCCKELMRQVPGRLVGETVDTMGRRGYVLTLQAREQHIRREKATSNICTNQNLAALASLITMLWYGKKGLKELALTNFQRAAYLHQGLTRLRGVKTIEGAPHFNEFIVKFPAPIDGVFHHFRTRGIEPGLDLSVFDPKWKDHLLVAVTETKTKEQLDHYLSVAKEVASGSHE